MRTSRAQVRLTPAEEAQLREQAAEHGHSVSDEIRAVLYGDPVAELAARLDGMTAKMDAIYAALTT